MSRRNLALLVAIAVVLLAPLARQALVAQTFLAGTIIRLDRIQEMFSVPRMASRPGGLRDVSLLYSLLIWLAPLSAIYCAIRGWAERQSGRLFFWVCCLLGLPMLLAQFRLHYFGSFALYLPWLVMADRVANAQPLRRKQILLGTTLGLLLMYALPVRYQLASHTTPADDPNFRSLRPILGDLQKACAREPGVVLADNDAGHYIRYYTECSVIANNFLLTRQHEEKIRQIDYLTSLPAEQLPAVAPYVRYLLLRPVTIAHVGADEYRYIAYSAQSAQLLSDLLLPPLDRIPSNYHLIEQASMSDSDQGKSIPYIRLFKVLPPR